MPFQFTCPYCFKKTLVDEVLAGQTGPCACCGKNVTIPGAPAKPPESTYPVDSQRVSVSPNRPGVQYLAVGLKIAGLFAVIGVFSLLAIYLLWPTFQGLKIRRDRVACMNNLQQIARALNAYADQYGSYPPPTVYDANGKAMHSWRVLILEQLGESGLYAQYDFNQPWDSTENSRVMSRCPQVYVSPASTNPTGSESTYQLITGNGTLFPKSGPLKPANIADGASNTLLVVEVANSANEWTKPLDIDFSKLNHKIGAGGINKIGGDHPEGATAVFADGQPAWLPEDLAPALLDAIITPNGGEPIDPRDYQMN